MKATRLIVAIGLVLSLAACADRSGSGDLPLTGPSPVPDLASGSGETLWSTVHPPLRTASNAPDPKKMWSSVWAIQGKKAKLVIEYPATPADSEPEKFLEFLVPSGTQIVAPDGRQLAEGDSILVEVKVVPGRLALIFKPEGVRFVGGAQLLVNVRYADTCGRAKDGLRLWYYPEDDQPPVTVPGYLDLRKNRVHAQLDHFSNYAVAY
jgi:hypothetical protein